jgi:hypothetical protein
VAQEPFARTAEDLIDVPVLKDLLVNHTLLDARKQ